MEEISSSNWQPPLAEGLGAGDEEMMGREVDMEDDIFVEEDAEEEEEVRPVPWRLVGRYLGQRTPSADALMAHFKAVWRLWMGVHFSEIKPKWFVITLFS